MKRQMAKIINHGTWRVIHDDSKTVNPYRITLNGRKVMDYADLRSCLWHITENTKEERCHEKEIYASGKI